MNLMNKMIASFLVVVFICGVGFGIIVYKAYHVTESITSVRDQELTRLKNVNEIAYNSLMQAAEIRGFILTGEDKHRQEYKEHSEENAKLITDLIGKARTEERKNKLIEIKSLDDKYREVVENKIIPLVLAGKKDEAVTVILLESGLIFQNLQSELDILKDMYQTVTDNVLTASVDSSQTTVSTSLTIGIFSAILGVLIGFFTARSISRPVNYLNQIAGKVADGNLTQTIVATSKDEIGQLTTSFDHMVSNMKTLIGRISSQSE